MATKVVVLCGWWALCCVVQRNGAALLRRVAAAVVYAAADDTSPLIKSSTVTFTNEAERHTSDRVTLSMASPDTALTTENLGTHTTEVAHLSS